MLRAIMSEWLRAIIGIRRLLPGRLNHNRYLKSMGPDPRAFSW